MDKKALRAQVEEKIESALAGFAKGVTDKKYKKHIKKAAKIIVDALEADGKKTATAKKAEAPKKAESKKAAPAKKAKAPAKKTAPAKKSAPKKAAKKTAKKAAPAAAESTPQAQLRGNYKLTALAK